MDARINKISRAVAEIFMVPYHMIYATSRSRIEHSTARQVAMYLANTFLGFDKAAVGRHFHRDRTTVTYACALVEDRREEPEFDALVAAVELKLAPMAASAAQHGDERVSA